MIQIFEELNAVPGFIGICLYDTDTQSLAKAMPGEYTVNELVARVNRLVDLHQSGSADFGPLQDVVLYEDDRMLLLEKISHTTYAYVLAEADINLFLLRIALKLLRELLLQQFPMTARG